MVSYFLLRYLHFIAIFVLVACVLIQHLALRPVVPRETIVRMRKINIIFAIFALVVLVTGLGQWFYGVKPSQFFTANGMMHTKVLLFFIVGGLSVVPTIFLKKNEKGDPGEKVEVPKKVVMCLRLELLLLFLIPLLATLLSYGIGLKQAA